MNVGNCAGCTRTKECGGKGGGGTGDTRKARLLCAAGAGWATVAHGGCGVLIGCDIFNLAAAHGLPNRHVRQRARFNCMRGVAACDWLLACREPLVAAADADGYLGYMGYLRGTFPPDQLILL